MNLEKKVELIVNFINLIYKPKDITVKQEHTFWEGKYYDEILIDVFVNHIDDKYVTNTQYINIDVLKQKNLALEIRNLIYKYFNIETSGLSFQGFSLYSFKGITILVHLNK
jgi:hypothetical protein